MLSSIYEDLGYTSAPQSGITSRIQKNINYAHTLILRDPVCAKLRDTMDSIAFASEVGRDTYGLPASIAILRYLTERDNDRRLVPITMEEARNVDPGRNANGTPYAFVPIGFKPITHQFNISTGSGLWAASTSAGDTQALRFNGIRLGGLMTGDISQALTGVTRVQIGSLTDIIDLESVSLATAAAGVVSLFNAASGGDTLGQIGVGEVAPQYYVIQLYPTPSAVTTYYVDGVYRIPSLSNVQEVPLLPEEFQTLPEDYARYKEYEKRNDDRLMIAKEAWDTGLAQLRYRVNTTPGLVPVMGRHRRRFSRFGPWAPAEDWSSW